MAKKKVVLKTTRKAAAKSTATAPAVAKPVDLAQAFRDSYTPPPALPSVQTVVLDPDVAGHFQSSRAVNEALRALLRIVKQVRS